jgi:NAD+ synthase (glutamine-hydrolysing)
LKLALGQINPVVGDFYKNRETVLAYVKKAKAAGADLVAFPELCLCGYPPMDLLDYDSFADRNLESLRWLQKNCPEGIAVCLGYVDKNRGKAGKPFVNNAAVICDGKVIHTQAKTLLPSYDVFDEARYFEPAGERRTFQFKGERIGIAICEDIWWEVEPVPGTRYPIDPVKDLLDDGATLILAPSASPYFADKVKIRKALVCGIGRSSGVPVLYVNTVGANDSLIFDGNSFVTDREGRPVFFAKGFAEDFGVVDLSQKQDEVVYETDRNADILDALVLGVRDYMGKCGFKKAHLGLSGGIDSALVAVIAARAVGPENVQAFALPSRFSSDASYNDAKELAENLGIGFGIIPIESLYAEYLKVLSPHFKGRAQDITEENLQARVRGNLLMAYSNKWNSLLLTTGNKSELATGYCTLYGDMCGGLAVIGDLFKTEVYAVCGHINAKARLIPEAILTKAPTAELKENQKDQDTLPPYDILDAILSLYLLKNLSREEIVEAGFDEALVRRVLVMVARAEYKRRQAPPVLKVSPKAFGTGRRIPIARVLHEA